jgi:rifampicin phosphotransferase
MTAAGRAVPARGTGNGVLLPDHAAVDPRLVGHKFARQAQLLADGFPVPRFFCVPGPVYDDVHADVLADLGGGPSRGHAEPTGADVVAWAERAHARIAGATVPADVAAELFARFDALVGPSGLVAVRASTTPRGTDTGEDSAVDPFAGLSDSFLYVDRDHLLDRVAACWASGFNPRAVQYRTIRGLDPLPGGVAVGVQRMVMAARSFVAFTRNPVDSAPECVIAAALGVGEGVVQERADLDHFYVGPGGRVTRTTIVHKTRMVGPDPVDPAAGPRNLPVPAALAGPPVLTGSEAEQIAALATRVESYFGAPQDIEGAMTEDGTIMLVQARPIVLAPSSAATPRLPARKPVAWANSNVVESFPGVCGMLTYSIAAELCELIFTDFYSRMGVPAASLRHRRYELRRMVGHLNGRLYYRLETWHLLHAQLPDFEQMRGTWGSAIGLRESAGPPAAAAVRSTPRLRRATLALTLLRGSLRSRREVRAYLRWWDATFAAALDRDDLSGQAGGLVEEYQRLWAEAGERIGIPSVNNFYGLWAVRLGDVLLRSWAPSADRGTLNGMLCGGRESRSAAALRSAIDLAERIRADPALRAAVRDGEERLVWDDIVARRYGSAFTAAAAEHVRRYGDRGPQDLKMETTTVRAAPWNLVRTLRPYVEQPLTVAGSRSQERAVHRAARQELRRACRGPLRRAALTGLFAAQRAFARRREDTRFCRSQLFGLSRDMLLAIGADLAASGVLRQREDVIDLTVAEVLGLYQGTFGTGEVQQVVELRRAEREGWSRSQAPPAHFTTDAGVPMPVALSGVGQSDPAEEVGGEPAGSAASVLSGIGSSPGRVRARARVVLSPELGSDDLQDRILVARETDPGWLFLMISSRGMVVEHGSPLSHTAITGRILSIPTVVGVAGATGRIRDGDWIEIDGSAGTVTFVGPPEDPA